MYKIGVTIRFKEDYYTMCVNRTYYSLLKEGPFELVVITPSSRAHYDWLAGQLDGVLITGGLDVDATLYGKPNHSSNHLEDPIIDQMDMDLIQAFLKKDKPIFGICRGIQIINTYYGGTLLQDIPSLHPTSIHHSQKELIGTRHDVTIQKGTFFAQFFEDMAVNSFHHQSIDQLAQGLIVNAISEDEIIEGIENDQVVAVQWHPERMDENHRQNFLKMMEARIKK